MSVVTRHSPFSRIRCKASARCGLRWLETAVIVEDRKEVVLDMMHEVF